MPRVTTTRWLTTVVVLGLGSSLCVAAAPGQPAGRLPDGAVLKAVLEQVDKSYVEPARIRPAQMFRAAARALDRDVPEVMVDEAAADGPLTVNVAGTRRVFAARSIRTVAELVRSAQELLRFVNAHRASASDARPEYVMVNGMLEALDPHSVLFDPAEARRFATAVSNRFSGIGVILGDARSAGSGASRGELMILSVRPRGPAEAAGVLACDRIIAVDDRLVTGLSLDELPDLVMGLEGSRVWITVQREGSGLVDFLTVRSQIVLPSVKSRLLEGGVGLIEIEHFGQGTAREVGKAVEELKTGGATAWILDLRRNPGGMFREATDTASLFIPSGPLATVVGERGQGSDVKASRSGASEAGPLAVLIGPWSASSSEILTGALQHRDRAVVLGRTSFGKGSVQVLFDQADGSKLKLTVAHYLAPGGVSLQARGITPDLELEPVPGSRGGRIRLSEGVAMREADLERSFSQSSVLPCPAATIRYLAATPDAEEEVVLARDFLLDTRWDSRQETVRHAAAFVEERRVAEERKIAQALREAGVDWTAEAAEASDASSAPLRVSVRCAQRGALSKERVRVECEVHNEGSRDAFRVHGQSSPGAFDLSHEEIVVGRVGAGSRRTIAFDGVPADDPAARVTDVPFTFRADGNVLVDCPPVRIEIAARPDSPGAGGPGGIQIQIEGDVRETAQERWPVAASVRDRTEIRDAWISVTNQQARLDRKKALFRSNSGSAARDRMTISEEIALRPGLNKIDVCARNPDGERCESAFVFRRAMASGANP
ncbi:MAG: S41 family peptidase [Thermoanaerobaculia bacterium]